MGKFKATEFRTILKYTGVVAFDSIIDGNIYKNFLLLHAAFTILAGPVCVRYNRLAREFILEFLRNSKSQYSAKFFSYNVHSLSHLWEDVLNQRLPLSAIDCFPFENFFVQLKSAIKSPYLPAEQIANRVKEGFFAICLDPDRVELTMPFTRKPFYVPAQHQCQELFRKFCLGNFLLYTTQNDSIFADKCGKMFQFLGVFQLPEPLLLVMPLLDPALTDLYDYPCKSSLLGIYKYNGSLVRGDQLPNGQTVQCIRVSDLGTKYICLPSCRDEALCLFPMTVTVSRKCKHCTGVL
jgi:hypothetical protein